MGRIVIIEGLSESGKSTIGKYLTEAYGFLLIKTKDIAKVLRDEDGSPLEYRDHIDYNMIYKPYEYSNNFIRFIKLVLDRNKHADIVIENVTHPSLIQSLKNICGYSLTVIYVDLSESMRIERQMRKERLTRSEAILKVIPRDIRRHLLGNNMIRSMADFIIDNSITIDELKCRIDSIFQEE